MARGWMNGGSHAQPAAASQPPVAKRARQTKWVDAEEAALLEHVARFGPRHWGRCARAIGPGRTSNVVRMRWHVAFQETDRGRAALARAPVGARVHTFWTDAEDEAVLEHVALFGEREWDQCARAVGSGRTAGSVGRRWSDIISKTERGRAALSRAPIVPRVEIRWTDAEEAALLEHVAQFGPREWELCARTMGTGRAARVVAARWNSRLKDTDRGRAALARTPVAPRVRARWTDADDAAILEHVAQFGQGEWDHCAETMGTGRTAAAVRDRWDRHLRDTDHGRAALSRAPMAKLRVTWTDAEDESVFKHVSQFGLRRPDWERCAEAMGTGRTAVAVRHRWAIHLKETDRGRAALAKASDVQRKWTDAEDEALFKHVAEYGPRSHAEWERCAMAIGTGRTAKAAEIHWHQDLEDAVGGALWE